MRPKGLQKTMTMWSKNFQKGIGISENGTELLTESQYHMFYL